MYFRNHCNGNTQELLVNTSKVLLNQELYNVAEDSLEVVPNCSESPEEFVLHQNKELYLSLHYYKSRSSQDLLEREFMDSLAHGTSSPMSINSPVGIP